MDSERLARVRRVAEAALERKAQDVLALDVAELTSFADTFLLASGTSDRQVRAIADALVERCKSDGMQVIGVEGYDDGRWILVDLNEMIVHVFLNEVREHYDLERLWGDAPVTGFGEPPAAEPDRQSLP